MAGRRNWCYLGEETTEHHTNPEELRYLTITKFGIIIWSSTRGNFNSHASQLFGSWTLPSWPVRRLQQAWDEPNGD